MPVKATVVPIQTVPVGDRVNVAEGIIVITTVEELVDPTASVTVTVYIELFVGHG